MLERIKQIFSIEGIVFILGIDRTQLEQAVKAAHGDGIDTDGYLRRFVHFNVNLPEPTVEKYCKFLFERFKLQEVFSKRRTGPEESESLMRAFVSLAKTYHFSLRVIEQCFTKINLVLRTTPTSERIFPFLLALLVAIKTEKPASYDLLLDSLSAAQVNTLTGALKQELDLNDRLYKWAVANSKRILSAAISKTPNSRTSHSMR
ncbi:MAG: hypothetical protein HXY38_03780 [Chloroflexi bacterium]|nr:hypothetical protein [Chloroflexota bacterium]